MLILWVVLFVVPIATEQYAYFRYVASNPKERTQYNRVSAISEFIWDSAHLIGLIMSVIRIVFIGSDGFALIIAIGSTVYLSGVVLRIISLREIGRSYARKIVMRDASQLVTTGPYHWFRHPLHLGTTLEIMGLAMFFPLPLAFLIIVITIATTVYRNYYEEQVLIAHLGLTYRQAIGRAWDLLDLFILHR